MTDFLLVFRASTDMRPTPEQLKEVSKPWLDWMGSLGAQNKLVDRGARLANEGKVVKTGQLITDGPYVEIKEAIGGFTIIRANSLEEATEISKGCPILDIGGSVEVRPIVPMN